MNLREVLICLFNISPFTLFGFVIWNQDCNCPNSNTEKSNNIKCLEHFILFLDSYVAFFLKKNE